MRKHPSDNSEGIQPRKHTNYLDTTNKSYYLLLWWKYQPAYHIFMSIHECPCHTLLLLIMISVKDTFFSLTRDFDAFLITIFVVYLTLPRIWSALKHLLVIKPGCKAEFALSVFHIYEFST